MLVGYPDIEPYEIARICAHYFSRHGRLDLTGPLVTAGEPEQASPAAELHVIAGAGHAGGPGMGETIVEALDRYAGRNA